MQHPARFLLTRGGLRAVESAQCHSHGREVKELVLPWPGVTRAVPGQVPAVSGVSACSPVPSSASPSLQPQGHFSEYTGQTGSCLLPPGLDPGIRSLMGRAI